MALLGCASDPNTPPQAQEMDTNAAEPVDTGSTVSPNHGAVEAPQQDLDYHPSDWIPTALNVQASLSPAISTVVTITWDTEVPTSGWVEVDGLSNGESRVTGSGEYTPSHEVVLLGLKPGTTFTYRVILEHEGEEVKSEDKTFTTGSLPTALPDVTVEVSQPDKANGGFFLTTVLGGFGSSISILDADGDFVWWKIDDRTEYWSTRARFAPDGSGIYYNSFPEDGVTEDSLVVATSWTGEDETAYTVPFAHHDFTLLPDNTIAAITRREDTVDGVWGFADGITEVSPDGTTTEIWSAWDVIAETFNTSSLIPGGDWTHFNAISYDEVDDAYYVGSYTLSTLYKVDRATGELLWTMGGWNSDWTLETEDASWFKNQHQFQLLDEGLLVFDNRAESGNTARIVEYKLDESTLTARESWLFQEDPPLYCFILGDLQRMDDGNTFVVWGTSGQISEVDAESKKVWQMNLSLGALFAYVDQVSALP